MKKMKKMVLQSSFLLIMISMISFGCKKEEDNEPTPTPYSNSVFTFYKVGASWTYNDFDSDDPSVIINESYTITAIDNDGYATVRWDVAGFSNNVQWFANSNKFSNLASKPLNQNLTLCTANPQVGNTWSETYNLGEGDITNTETIESINETITVPAGTFSNVIRIRETTSDDPVYYKLYWFSKEHGILKTEGTTTEDYPTIIYTELKTKI